MKIEYDVSNNFARIYDEALGVASKKRRIVKTKKINTINYTIKGLIHIFIYASMLIFTYIFNDKICLCNTSALSFILFIYLLFILYYYFLYFIRIIVRRKRKNIILIDEVGLTDSTFDGVKILFEWSKIKAVVIKKHSIVILTSYPIYFFTNIEIKDKLIKEMKKYNKDLIILE